MAAEQELELHVIHKGRTMAKLQAYGNPRDTEAMRDHLADWLERNNWGKGRWIEFHLVIRDAAHGRKAGTGEVSMT